MYAGAHGSVNVLNANLCADLNRRVLCDCSHTDRYVQNESGRTRAPSIPNIFTCEYKMTNSLIVKAYGLQLDELRSEASRITRDHGFKWSAETPDRGFRFSFTDSASKNDFAAFCSDLGVSFTVADALRF